VCHSARAALPPHGFFSFPLERRQHGAERQQTLYVLGRVLIEFVMSDWPPNSGAEADIARGR
jgi:hypothetical protein